MLENYTKFVDAVTSEPSKNTEILINRIRELEGAGCNVSRLMTASDGISAEAGELKEIVKKMLYQGKPYNDDNAFHMKRELGDIMFYWITACIALSVNPEEIIEENVRKLESRYPGGKFDVNNSEVRKEGDI